jgi:Lipoprotein LpqB beta-propeller domain/Sporulation and spore germination
MSEPTRVRVALAAALAAVALTMAGCGGIPSSGPVHAGAQLEGPPPVRVLPNPPEPGASAADIIRGFLRAEPGLDDDEAVARSYLTGDAARGWARRPEVVVYPDDTTLTIAGGSNGAFTVSTPVSATVDVDGIYTAARPGTKATLHLQVEKVNGEWRVGQLDNLEQRWLTTYDLDRVYRQIPLYYGLSGTKVLVPDLRWFALTQGLSTAVARAQLVPPPAYLRAAVTTGVPDSTTLAVDSVPNSGAIAAIDLTANALSANPAARSMLWAQLAGSVTQTPGVEAVRVLVNGKPLELPGQSLVSGATTTSLGYTTEPAVTADPVALSSKGTTSVLTQILSTGEAQVPARQSVLPVSEIQLRSLTRSADAREFAGIDELGHSLVRVEGGKGSAVVATGTDLTKPSYDPQGWLWTASSGIGVPTQLRAVQTGATVPLKTVTLASPSAPWLVDRQVSAVRLSRDGARALVTSHGKSGWRIDVSGVVRDAHGRPLSLGAPLRIGIDLTDVVDATWVDGTSVAVLAEGASDKHVEPYVVSVGGLATALPGVVGAVGIAAGSGESTITIVTAKGDVLGRTGSISWSTIGHGDGVAFPG